MEEMGQNQRGVPNDGACDRRRCYTALQWRNDVRPKVPGRARTRIVFKLVLLPDSEPLIVEIDQPGTHARVHLALGRMLPPPGMIAKKWLATESV